MSESQSSVVKRVISGSVTIHSAEEFENIVKIFPNDPRVYRAFADWLAKKKLLDMAARNYRIATRLFLENGMLLQATVSKIFEWRIIKPSHKEGRAFYRALQVAAFSKPLDRFLAGMTYPELVAFMVRLVRLEYPEGTVVKKEGEPETALYMVVSGRLHETTYGHASSRQGLASTELVKNDFFGNIYPFGEDISSVSDVEAMTGVELVKMTRERLAVICKKHPQIEEGLKALYASCPPPGQRDRATDERKAKRHRLPVPFTLKIFADQGDQDPIVVEGATEDIASGGVCLMLQEPSVAGSPKGLVGKNVWVEIDLPTTEEMVKAFGTVVWSRGLMDKDGQKTAIGIEFSDLSDESRGLVEEYCQGCDGEQNLMWRLWESYKRLTKKK